MTDQPLRIFLLICLVQGLASCSSLLSTAPPQDSVKPTLQSQVAQRAVESRAISVPENMSRAISVPENMSRAISVPENMTHESLMERMTGDWVMQGTIDDAAVTNDVYIDRILNRQYVRIHQISREKDAVGQPTYEAWIHIAWDQKNAEFVVMWLDNTGVTNFSADGVGHGKPDGDQIPFTWKLADGSGIHNTFAYDRASDTWSWKIDNLDSSGKSSPFGRVTLKRK